MFYIIFYYCEKLQKLKVKTFAKSFLNVFILCVTSFFVIRSRNIDINADAHVNFVVGPSLCQSINQSVHELSLKAHILPIHCTMG